MNRSRDGATCSGCGARISLEGDRETSCGVFVCDHCADTLDADIAEKKLAFPA